MRRLNKLTTLQVKNSKTGRTGDGGGLYLVTAPTGSRKWIFRFSWNGHPTEHGLGSAQNVTLAEARERAAAARKLVAAGLNPIDARRRAKELPGPGITFGQLAEALIAAKSPQWRSAVHRQQWRQSLQDHCQSLWGIPVAEITTAAVLEVLTPIWGRIPETASRLRGRIEAVLSYAQAIGHIPAERANPARWKGHLDHLLPRRQAVARDHHAAMPWPDVPRFLELLRRQGSVAALCLEFAILTAARSGEARGSRWEEFSNEAVWTIPSARMKAGREHRVPLSRQAARIVTAMKAIRSSEYVFSATGKPLGASSLRAVLHNTWGGPATVHGFRSSFVDWAAEIAHAQPEVAEGCLAHTVGSAVSRAYQRSDMLERRRELMQRWADFCDG